MRILIDAGHGLPFTGAVHYGVRECDINLVVSKQLKRVLEVFSPSYSVSLTRTNSGALCSKNEWVDIDRRIQKANDGEFGLLISLQCGEDSDKSVSGIEVLTADSNVAIDSRKSYRAAEEIAAHVQHMFPQKRVRTMDMDDLFLQTASQLKSSQTLTSSNSAPKYDVLAEVICPAVLVNMGFLSNYDDCQRLTEKSEQDRLALAVATGILVWSGK